MSKSKIVFANGGFDILHAGHFNLLSECRSLAGEIGTVIVGLDSDEKIKNDKGIQRPFFTLSEREKHLRILTVDELPLVDRIRSFNTNEELYDLILELKPDYIVKGADWDGKEVIGSDECRVIFATYNSEISSTIIANRIVQKTLQYDFRNEIVNPFDRPEEK